MEEEENVFADQVRDLIDVYKIRPEKIAVEADCTAWTVRNWYEGRAGKKVHQRMRRVVDRIWNREKEKAERKAAGGGE